MEIRCEHGESRRSLCQQVGCCAFANDNSGSERSRIFKCARKHVQPRGATGAEHHMYLARGVTNCNIGEPISIEVCYNGTDKVRAATKTPLLLNLERVVVDIPNPRLNTEVVPSDGDKVDRVVIVPVAERRDAEIDCVLEAQIRCDILEELGWRPVVRGRQRCEHQQGHRCNSNTSLHFPQETKRHLARTKRLPETDLLPQLAEETFMMMTTTR